MITNRGLGHHGRLGNALYQLAATIGIAMDRHEEVVFPADWMHRPYFSLPDELFADIIPDDAVEATEYAQHLDPRCRDYLQDINLFWPYMGMIKSFLQPSELAIDILSHYKLPKHPRLAVHVRRGDKVQGADPGVPNNTDYHLCPPIEYYDQGIQRLVTVDNHKSICVFSDDVLWCREHIKAPFYGDGRSYWKEHEERFGIDEPRDWIDLFLMSRCDYFVLSGSTFGIWAAFLGNALPKCVVRPQKVYGPLLDYIDESVMFNPKWGILNVA